MHSALRRALRQGIRTPRGTESGEGRIVRCAAHHAERRRENSALRRGIRTPHGKEKG